MKQNIVNFAGISQDLLRPVAGPERPAAGLQPWLPAARTLLVPACRNAIYYGYRALRLAKAAQTLVPAFVCDTVSKPLAQAGANMLLFNIHADGRIDWGHLESLMTRGHKVRAMLWYHYLGLSFEFDEVRAFCRRHGLYLIEDCAHALFGRCGGRPVGSIGDVAVFSIHKTLPAVRAGALVVNNRTLKLPKPPVAKLTAARAALLHEYEAYLLRLNLQSQDFARPVERKSHLYFGQEMARLYRDTSALHAVDATSLLVMHNADGERVRRARQRNFKAYLAGLGDIALFKRMTPGASPLVFPILVAGRNEFRVRLKAEGVDTLTHWPAWLLPKGVAKRFPETLQLAESHVTLPCHQDLGVGQIEYVCRAVRKVL